MLVGAWDRGILKAPISSRAVLHIVLSSQDHGRPTKVRRSVGLSGGPEEIMEFQDLVKGWDSAFVPLAILTSLLMYVHFRMKFSKTRMTVDLIPGPPTLPFVGNLHQIISHLRPEQLIKYVLDQDKVYGHNRALRVWAGPFPIVILYDPSDLEVVLSSSEHIDKSTEYRWFKPWLGEGLLISSGSKWRRHRRLIAPAFHLHVLKSFVPRFNSNARTLVERLRKEAERGTEFDVHDYMSETTVDVLVETAMGVQKESVGNKSGFEYAMAVMRLCDIVHQRAYKVWLRAESIFKFSSFSKEQEKLLDIIHGLSKAVISKKKEMVLEDIKEGKQQTLEENIENNDISGTFFDSKGYIKDDLDDDVGGKKRLPFLELLLEAARNGNFTDGEIKEEVDTIMFEGHDTTAAGSSFVLCLLGIHQHIQDRVVEELNEIFGDAERAVTFADTLQMKYLERVILETLRMYPPVPVIARRLNQPVTLGTGYTVPANCTVVIATYKVHRHPKYYPNPDVFDPDNFLPERAAARHYYSYIPFSAGPRSCVGRKYAMLKLKVLLATVLRSYRVRSDVPEAEFRLRGDIILKRHDGFRLRLEPRRPAPAPA